MAPECNDRAGGSSTHGTLNTKSEKDATECKTNTTEEEGAIPEIRLNAGKDTKVSETSKDPDCATSVRGVLNLRDTKAFGREVNGTYPVADPSKLIIKLSSDRNSREGIPTSVKGKNATATGGGDIGNDRAGISTRYGVKLAS